VIVRRRATPARALLSTWSSCRHIGMFVNGRPLVVRVARRRRAEPTGFDAPGTARNRGLKGAGKYNPNDRAHKCTRGAVYSYATASWLARIAAGEGETRPARGPRQRLRARASTGRRPLARRPNEALLAAASSRRHAPVTQAPEWRAWRLMTKRGMRSGCCAARRRRAFDWASSWLPTLRQLAPQTARGSAGALGWPSPVMPPAHTDGPESAAYVGRRSRSTSDACRWISWTAASADPPLLGELAKQRAWRRERDDRQAEGERWVRLFGHDAPGL
jgi:hypothetical protein